MRSSTSSSDARAWRRFAAVLVGTAASGALLVWLFVVLVDPFGRLPISLPFDRGPVDGNARYAFPMLARDSRFDSAMFGTSTTRLLRPVTLDPLLDARIANLSMNSATVYEQTRMLEVFLHAHPEPRVIMFGVDVEWCQVADAPRRFTDRPFPEWLFSGSPWAGYREMADFYAVEKAAQAFAEWTGLKRRVYGRDGYTQFVPDDSRYDPARVAALMRGAAPYLPRSGLDGAPGAWSMPDLGLARAAIATIPPSTRVLLVVMPASRRLIPEPGSPASTVLDECKRRVAAIAASRPRTLAIDFLFASPITERDDNFWDSNHYRAAIADRIARDVAGALRGEASDDYRVLAPAPPPL